MTSVNSIFEHLTTQNYIAIITDDVNAPKNILRAFETISPSTKVGLASTTKKAADALVRAASIEDNFKQIKSIGSFENAFKYLASNVVDENVFYFTRLFLSA